MYHTQFRPGNTPLCIAPIQPWMHATRYHTSSSSKTFDQSFDGKCFSLTSGQPQVVGSPSVVPGQTLITIIYEVTAESLNISAFAYRTSIRLSWPRRENNSRSLYKVVSQPVAASPMALVNKGKEWRIFLLMNIAL